MSDTCKRMWTERQVRGMAVDSVEEKENLKVFEHIVDKDGHKRFIEGDITMETITGVTQSYGKWSLSGSHLMIVLCASIENAASITAGTTLARIAIPAWIHEKLVPMVTGSDYISRLTTNWWGSDLTLQQVSCNLRK